MKSVLLVDDSATMLMSLKGSLEISGFRVETAPDGVDLDEVRRHLGDLDGVEAVHDLHASTIGTGLPVVTAHLVVPEQAFTDGRVTALLVEAHDCLREHFPVCFEHATIQIETDAFSVSEPDALHA